MSGWAGHSIWVSLLPTFYSYPQIDRAAVPASRLHSERSYSYWVKLARPHVVPNAPADRRTLSEEVLVVLALSFLASAAYAILSILEAPIAGVRVASVNQSS